jgi:hypothetical protein
MICTPEEKVLFEEIQKKLFYIIPEKWDKIYLYASCIDIKNARSRGEMFFYYFPKGIIKKKPVNCYEIPGLFDIDEQEYSKFIQDLFQTIKKLREILYKHRRRIWTNVVISIEGFQFKIEYGYENIALLPFDPYERHIIFRYQYIDDKVDLYTKRDKQIVNKYIDFITKHGKPIREGYVEPMQKQIEKNIIDYEKTLTVDEAIEQNRLLHQDKKKKKLNILPKKKKEVEEVPTFNNELLSYWNNAGNNPSINNNSENKK